MLVDALDVVPLGSRRSGEWMDAAHELSHLRINVCHSLTYGVVLQVAMPGLTTHRCMSLKQCGPLMSPMSIPLKSCDDEYGTDDQCK